MTEYNVRVSIIIPHWNGIDILSECLISLFKTKYDSYEVIVVDNASTDGSQSWVKNTYPQIKLIENKKNYGYAGGCNLGALEAKGEYLVFLNNDTIQVDNPATLKSIGNVPKCGKDETKNAIDAANDAFLTCKNFCIF